MHSVWKYYIFFLPSDTFHVTRYTQKFTHFQEIFIFYNFTFVANLVFFTPNWSRITKLTLWKVWDLEVKPSRRYSLAKALESKMAGWLCYSSSIFMGLWSENVNSLFKERFHSRDKRPYLCPQTKEDLQPHGLTWGHVIATESVHSSGCYTTYPSFFLCDVLILSLRCIATQVALIKQTTLG